LAITVTEHGAALLALLRQLVNQTGAAAPEEGAPAEGAAPSSRIPGHYQHIPVTIQE
jgi:hypothetical protein